MNETITKKLILLTDFIDSRVRKEKELEYYQKQLEEIQDKMYWLNRELELTNTIISLVESDKIVDVRENLIGKANDNKRDGV
mgnify:CR=1 FL=1|tara:strand:- start:809 stop:1054 length:246 start_codon:yes stop_codon:yes gene_type:complete